MDWTYAKQRPTQFGDNKNFPFTKSNGRLTGARYLRIIKAHARMVRSVPTFRQQETFIDKVKRLFRRKSK